MRSLSIFGNALAARLLFTIPIITRGSFAINTTSVQEGDTFLAIAYNAGIPVESLEAANPGIIATDLYVGQVVTVPTNNEPTTGTLASNQASSTATAAALTTLVTSASTPVSSNSLPSGSSPTSPVSASGSSTAASFRTSTADSSTTTSPTSTSVSSTVPSTITTSVSSSTLSSTITPSGPSLTTSSTSTSVSSTVPSTTMTTVSSSTLSSTTTPSGSSTAASSPTSTSILPSSTPPVTSTIPPTPPPSTVPSSTTASSTTNSPPAPPSCRPTPSGKYVNVANVQSETSNFCEYNGDFLLTAIQGDNGVLNGDSQNANHNDGSTNGERGYNMTVTVIPNCSIEGATVMNPLPSNAAFNCTALLYSTYSKCTGNEGMGGSVAAGCAIYAFFPDP